MTHKSQVLSVLLHRTEIWTRLEWYLSERKEVDVNLDVVQHIQGIRLQYWGTCRPNKAKLNASHSTFQQRSRIKGEDDDLRIGR